MLEAHGVFSAMTTNNMKTLSQILRLLVLASLLATAQAQAVSIPDPLDAAVRAALQKPAEPLTVHDLLSLTNLDASYSGVRSLEGPGAAQNLAILHPNRSGDC
jgi:hypothetical protein